MVALTMANVTWFDECLINDNKEIKTTWELLTTLQLCIAIQTKVLVHGGSQRRQALNIDCNFSKADDQI
jgi:hypothetical protein